MGEPSTRLPYRARWTGAPSRGQDAPPMEMVLFVPGFFGFGALGHPDRPLVEYFAHVEDALLRGQMRPLRFAVHQPPPASSLASRVRSLHAKASELIAAGATAPAPHRSLHRRARCAAARAPAVYGTARTQRADRPHRLDHHHLRSVPRHAARAQGGPRGVAGRAGSLVRQHPRQPPPPAPVMRSGSGFDEARFRALWRAVARKLPDGPPGVSSRA